MLTLGPVEFNSQPGQHLGHERAVLLAQHLARLVQQQDEAMIGHPGIAESSTSRHHRAGKQLRLFDAARDIGGLEASPARLGKIARSELSFAEIAK